MVRLREKARSRREEKIDLHEKLGLCLCVCDRQRKRIVGGGKITNELNS